MSATCLTPDSPRWPTFAPSWASHADVESGGTTVTFSRCWTVPAVFREVEPLDVVTVTEEFERAPEGLFEAQGPRVSIGSTGVWADRRFREVAVTLREIADALDPVPAA